MRQARHARGQVPALRLGSRDGRGARDAPSGTWEDRENGLRLEPALRLGARDDRVSRDGIGRLIVARGHCRSMHAQRRGTSREEGVYM